MAELKVGDKAPEFTLDSTHGTVSLTDMLARAARGVVVYFYPRAFTPGCTTEACGFRDSLASLQGAGYEVVGISKDDMAALEKFEANQLLTFPLLSDPEGTVIDAYGAFGEKMSFGRKILGPKRCTFVVNPDGTIALAQYGVRASGHVKRLRRELGID